MSHGGSVRTLFLSVCVCMSVNKPDDGQGCVPKLLLSDLCTAEEPDKCLQVSLSLLVCFLGNAGRQGKVLIHTTFLSLTPS